MRFLGRLGAVAAGLLTGLAAVVLHDFVWALVLAWAATVLSVYALAPGVQGRIPYAVGWMLAAGLGVWTPPSGGYLMGSDAHGYLVVALAIVVLSLSIATIPVKGRRRLARHDQPTGDAHDLAV